MGKPGAEHSLRRLLSRRALVIAMALAGLAGGVVFLALLRREVRSTSPESGGTLLTALSLMNFLLLLTLLFVLFRQLIKGFLEWRRFREGARFRTRLLISFVLLGLTPSLLLFVGAIQLFESTLDRWYQLPVHTISSAGQKMVDQALDMVRTQTYRDASGLAGQLGQVPLELRPALARHLYSFGNIDELFLIDPSGKVLVALPANAAVPDAYKVSKCFEADGLRGWMDLTPKPVVMSGVRIDGVSAVAVGAYIPHELFDQARFISENNQAFLRAKSERRDVEITMISSYLALTLVIIVAAVWIGSSLSKEISVPLKLLLEGTREVSGGNMSHQIPYEAKDEIGQVVTSFNKMTMDLAESQRSLERSNEELRQISRDAERRRRYIEMLMETLPLGVVSFGTEGDVRTVNPRARELMGMEPSDPPYRLLTRPEWNEMRGALEGFPARPVANREAALSGRQGQRIISVSARSLEEKAGGLFGSLVLLEDISDLSRAQRIAAWQEVARRLAHEIKNPLTPIRLSAQRIRKKVREKAEDLEPAVMEGTTTIEREVEGMMAMVNEFSRFARLPEIHPKPSSLAGLIRDAVSTYRAAYTKVEFELELPNDFPPVRIDSENLSRALKNLFENAIEAMEMQGSISVKLDEWSGMARLVIRDSGPGIPKEARTRLFLPYYSTKKRGTGLGLAIVARVLEEHGGSIVVDESYEGGAGFIITLPL